MTAAFRQYWPGCGVAALMLFCSPVQAVTTIKVTVTIVAPPPCVINNNNLIEVNFGNDVMTTRIDGSYKKQPVVYSVECKNAPNNAMKLQIQGVSAGFDSEVLKTNKDGLGVALLRNGNRQPINTWVNFTYPNLPTLEAVPVKQAGATLSGGEFSAGATMKVEYQ
ncbi:fimbrial protein [Serratia marcescens]|uniref:fimbrial protein n=2 Tax=Enterobacterales TaxID=91347 RepID=UPI00140D6BDD|nr:fimbrial protein [Serratia marcescens]EGS9994242.1 fimbrial protein [Serratia marcescens]MBH2985426.1 fimbrial protein [Serratia marcescens]MBH3072577.1 fimbrial protein [Serratia marcescens]QIO26461.1 fimbrial protein [Serratia marcescens]HEJ0331723.1 fimbrial protein [Serratia marcescens]